MEEKILIKGKKNFPLLFVIIHVLLIAALFLAKNSYSRDSEFFFEALIVIAVLSLLVCLILSSLLNITVTNKKVFGVTSKYAKADIKIENIELINLVNPYSISIKATTGEFIYLFNGFNNAPEIVETINQLISNQEEKNN